MGADVLAQPVTKTVGGLRLTVNHVYYPRHFTRVAVLATNAGNDSVSLPLFGCCVFAGQGGKTLQADAFRSDWSDTLPPGVPSSGTITFSRQATGRRYEGVLEFHSDFRTGRWLHHCSRHPAGRPAVPNTG